MSIEIQLLEVRIQYNIIFVIPFRNPHNLNIEKFLLKVLITFPCRSIRIQLYVFLAFLKLML